MKRLLNLGLIAALVASSAVGACYNPPARYGVAYITTAPPSPRYEVISTSPGLNYVWVGGHWGWASNNYSWVPGSWVVPARGYSVWSPGRWDRDGRGWYWTAGHWR
jgi:hypothetical protein